MHCAQLETYVLALAQNISADNFAGEWEMQEALKTYQDLSELSLWTGCRTQVCDVLTSTLNYKRDNSDNDHLVDLLLRMECPKYYTYEVPFGPCYAVQLFVSLAFFPREQSWS